MILIQLVPNCVFPDNLVVIRNQCSFGESFLLFFFSGHAAKNSNVLNCISHLSV